MTIRRLTFALLAVALLTLAACSQDVSKADIKEPQIKSDVLPADYEALAPDKLTVFVNVDNHPNIVRLCIDGLAFRTVSTTYASLATPAVDRVPEWDTYCQQ